MRSLRALVAVIALFGSATVASADTWTLDPALSNVSFGSIKNETIGEIHTFNDISGSVSDDGTVTLELDLGSVDTLIPIRNERMIEFVFQNAPTATVTAKVDKAALEELAVGTSTVVSTAGTISFLGNETTLNTSFFVYRISEGQVMVVTEGMTMLSTGNLGIDGGVDVLQQLASLDSITRVSPVTMRLVFDLDA